ncbi:YgfZ/GcvT domain-containing protein [Pseudomonas typographi]|uniref:Folate-binding protein YgfZ n=1 Tax=Pseudomonas typographi TaxID=2715964 RepID=A0ABR7Z9C9_9PSED|nr:folate-binding protein YgfZ [Pseudomonas typographi]MBD1553713.1 folate-binding protein YgfZ [Pseudomonas typographi]MBD1602140.1 folate-binding protein YgfZ [Pseudomonas typographi]
MANTTFYCPLSHEGVLAVRGSDARKFLQGQLTCNLNYLDEAHAGLGARCTPKGRMQSSFRIVLEGDGCLLAMARELLPAQLADLKKYAVFSKATLADESTQWQRFGLQQGDAALQALGLQLPAETHAVARQGSTLAIRVSPGRAELWVAAAAAGQTVEVLAQHLPQGDLDGWLLGQVRAGVGQVFEQTRELFIPQMINLQAVGGVSFKKGCYAGQEIVARMQYLGKLKRRQYRLRLPGGNVPAPGTLLFSPVHASAVGEVVIGASAGDTVELLAVLQADAVEDGNIHLAEAGGAPLEVLDLPYELDRDREIQR